MSTRVLVAARLSRSSDEASRIERDDEKARAWAEANGRQVAATVEDAGVSGSVSPFKRKGLGPWLDTEGVLIHDYDEIVASSVDRLGRNFRDMCALRDWAEDTHKGITVLDPPLHWPPAPDDVLTPIMWDLLARFAQWELQTITKRHRDARVKVRENGGYVGRPPFGFEVVGEKYSRTIQPIPNLTPAIRELVRRALRGDTLLSMAQWLDSEGICCPQLGKVANGKVVTGWSPTSVKSFLTNPVLKGKQVSKDGRVMHTHQGIMSVGEWNELQVAVQRGQKRDKGRKRMEERRRYSPARSSARSVEVPRTASDFQPSKGRYQEDD